MTLLLGSAEWLRHVRGTPPVRDPRGRSRPTSQFSPYSKHLGRNVGIEGGNELTAFLLMEALHAGRMIRWFKEQPFELNETDHGLKAIPDFMFEWHDGTKYVVEVKAAAFITSTEQAKLNRLTALFESIGIKYVLWTDKEQLCKPLWTNVRSLWKERDTYHEPSVISDLSERLAKGPVRLDALVRAGIDPDAVLHVAARGHASFNLTSRWSVATTITREPHESDYHNFLGARHDPERWWNTLQSA